MRCALIALLLLNVFPGCSALYLTDTDAIEHKLEVLNRIPKTEYRPIDLRLLGQTPPPEHLVGDGDVLGIYIEGGPGETSGQMPVRFPDDRNVAPAIGYPIPVRNGGYIRVPEVGLLYVRGMTIWQIEERIRHILLNEEKTHLPDKTQIHVSLMYKRAVDVMVIRQEETDAAKLLAPSNGADADRRTGQVVQLPMFRNDVLNALLETGGLPAGEAENSVYIYKRNDRKFAGRQGLPTGMVPQSQLQPLARNTGSQTNSAPDLPSRNSAHAQGSPIQKLSYSSDAAGVDMTGVDMTSFNVSSRESASNGQLFAADRSIPLKSTTVSQPWPPQSKMLHSSLAGHSLISNVRPVSYQQQAVNVPVTDQLFTQNVASIPGGYHSSFGAGLASNSAPNMPVTGADPNSRHPHAIRIPLTVASSERLGVSQNDVILEDGDIVLVESRNDEYFITGGLLGGGQYSLPRDRDIDVIDAVLLADTYSRTTQINQPTRAIGGVSVLNRDVTVGASRVVVERKLKSGATHQFRLSLYKAMRDPSHRILIQPGDRLFLEYTLPESMLAFLERHILDPFTAGLPTVIGPR